MFESLLQKYAKYFAFGVLIVSIFLMGYVVYEITQAKQLFANQLIKKSVEQTESDLNNFFSRIEHLINASEQQYKLGFWKDLSKEKAIIHSISLIKNYDPISSIGIADQRGYEFNIMPDSVDGQWLTRKVFVDHWGFTEKWSRWSLEDSLTRMNRWYNTLEVDPRERPWFQGALQRRGSIFWTAPYEYTTGADIGVTASILIPNTDPYSKIVAFDLTLGDLNEFVDDLELTKNQNIFLLTSDNSKVIALNKLNPNSSLPELNSTVLISPERLNNPILLEVLKKGVNREAFDFTINNETWWCISKPYYITKNRSINIISVLPEGDFALEVTKTFWVGIGSFFLILFLSFIVVRNHNKLHRISNNLAQKNKLISEQKKFLFSEVHHRVKNNLALLSAFVELELFKVSHPLTRDYLQQALNRIRMIAIIQEEAYKSDNLGRVPVDQLVPKIIDHIKKTVNGAMISQQYCNAEINVNQALTYGLLLNEILPRIINTQQHNKHKTSIKVSLINSSLNTEIEFSLDKKMEEIISDIRNAEIVTAFINQLNAEFDTQSDNKIIVRFKLENKKGIVGSKFYNRNY